MQIVMASDLRKYSAIIAISGDGTLNEIFTALIARPDSAKAVPPATSHTVFLKLFCEIQFPRKSVNLFFTSVIVKDKFTDFWKG
jgi:hypothetical protein